jgi:glycosyltransferase involved in cell wall biosynthesis
LKICITNTFFPPWRGGAETYTYNLAKNLALLGHNVEVLCANDPELPGKRTIDGIKVHRLRSRGRIYGVPIVPKLPCELAKMDADILHANFPNPYNASIASLTSLLHDVPSVLTWHNDLPPVTLTASVIAYIHDNLIAPVYLRNFKRIISTSEPYAETSKTLQRYREKVVIIPNGVDTERFNPSIDGSQIRADHGLEDCKVILFVGALTKWHRYKGLDVLIKAFIEIQRQLDEARLLIVGDGDLKPEYQALCLTVAAKVIFAGNADDDELLNYYAASDLLVLPSIDRSEGFGLTLLEANATGKPVVASRVGGIPSVVKHGVNGLLVPPRDEKTLAETITNLMKDEDRFHEMGLNGRRIAEAHTWKQIVKKTEELYREVLEDSWDG